MKIEQPNVYYNKQRKHWVCDLRYHGHGRKAFHTKELAVTEAQKFFGGLIEHGTRNHNQVDLPLDVITDVKRSMQLISPLGLSIFEVCKSYVDLVNQNKSAVAVKVFDAGEAWIKTKKLEPITTGTVINHQSRLNAFYRKYGNRLIHEITPEEMHEYIFGLPFKTESKKDYRKTLREFFQWCIYPKKYIKVNPCAFVKFGRRILKPATILNLKEAEKMFKAALNADQDIKNYVLLCLFAGLRPKAEAKSIYREQIGSKQIAIHSSKTKHNRLVPLEDGLFELLTDPKWDGKLIQPNFQKRWSKFRKALGFKTWTQDLLRHTYCSYHYSAFRNEALSCANAGHDARVFRQRYQNVMAQEESLKYWGMLKGELVAS